MTLNCIQTAISFWWWIPLSDGSKTTPPNKEEEPQEPQEPQGFKKRTNGGTSPQSVYLILGITFVGLIPAAIISVALFFAMKRRRECGKNANYPPGKNSISLEIHFIDQLRLIIKVAIVTD